MGLAVAAVTSRLVDRDSRPTRPTPQDLFYIYYVSQVQYNCAGNECQVVSTKDGLATPPAGFNQLIKFPIIYHVTNRL